MKKLDTHQKKTENLQKTTKLFKVFEKIKTSFVRAEKQAKLLLRRLINNCNYTVRIKKRQLAKFREAPKNLDRHKINKKSNFSFFAKILQAISVLQKIFTNMVLHKHGLINQFLHGNFSKICQLIFLNKSVCPIS